MISVFELALGEAPVEEELISTRNVPLLGGWNAMSPESPEIQAAAKKAVEQFNTESKAKKFFKLLDVSSAETQVTNLINYKIHATIGKTKCRKTENADLETCDMAKKRLQCHFHVQYNPRNEELTVVATSCKR
ncbi:cystatin-1 isoform X2 [Clupea harengus]|uniref:Cystatin-1 isoform X2 n=1 Tax=Clupea harengus TaxID=7950 RepID=A0A6P8FZ81_CLUHA|nr:cystatin-1 isoform X2 [Clupea harengus]